MGPSVSRELQRECLGHLARIAATEQAPAPAGPPCRRCSKRPKKSAPLARPARLNLLPDSLIVKILSHAGQDEADRLQGLANLARAAASCRQLAALVGRHALVLLAAWLDEAFGPSHPDGGMAERLVARFRGPFRILRALARFFDGAGARRRDGACAPLNAVVGERVRAAGLSELVASVASTEAEGRAWPATGAVSSDRLAGTFALAPFLAEVDPSTQCGTLDVGVAPGAGGGDPRPWAALVVQEEHQQQPQPQAAHPLPPVVHILDTAVPDAPLVVAVCVLDDFRGHGIEPRLSNMLMQTWDGPVAAEWNESCRRQPQLQRRRHRRHRYRRTSARSHAKGAACSMHAGPVQARWARTVSSLRAGTSSSTPESRA
eukprot:tig00000681_g3131.t1